MAKTTTMRLVELMVLKEDIRTVLTYLGKKGIFQFQKDLNQISPDKDVSNTDSEILKKLQEVRKTLEIKDKVHFSGDLNFPEEEDYSQAKKLIDQVEELKKRELDAEENCKKTSEAYDEALAFSNLKVSYTDLESLSFITMRIGKIEPSKLDDIKAAVGNKALIVKLGEDGSRIIAVCQKKDRISLDCELKTFGFEELAIPKDFKGIPSDVLLTLENSKSSAEGERKVVAEEKKNFADTHSSLLLSLVKKFSVGSQVVEVESKLESTEYVYRISGWIPAYATREVMKDLDELTKGRAAIREYLPNEVASVASGEEKVPVQLKHGKLVGNFERMIFSYGSPLYGAVDPTPFVAIFFTVLFGIMFGDAGQGLVFLLAGILMVNKKFRLMGWEKFGPIFICIGVSSTIMGLLTGEFFASSEVLAPFSRWVTGLFGQPRDEILPMMPEGNAESIKRMFLFFGFTVGVGFIINSCGLIINMVNNFNLGRKGRAIFGKNGISGALFFWYVVFFALAVAIFHHVPAWYDWTIIGVTLALTAFSEPLERLVEGERPVFENGLFSAVIAAIVEIIEVLSSYISNTVSFLRVGAFALAHAVLGFIIELLAGLGGPVVHVLVLVLGNAIVIVLEGMIVAIQVVRLQYYEFFSKFFTETGREFKAFAFEDRTNN